MVQVHLALNMMLYIKELNHCKISEGNNVQRKDLSKGIEKPDHSHCIDWNEVSVLQNNGN